MNTVERVLNECKKQGMTVSTLEKWCGFANGYISGLRKGTMPADRLQKVADLLNVPYEYLLTGEMPEEKEGYYINPDTADMAQQIYENKDLRLLFDVAKDVTPEQLKLLHDLALSWKK